MLNKKQKTIKKFVVDITRERLDISPIMSRIPRKWLRKSTQLLGMRSMTIRHMSESGAKPDPAVLDEIEETTGMKFMDKLLTWMQADLQPDNIEKYFQDSKQKEMIQDQSYRAERVKVLGEELAAAHFILHRDGRVKIKGHEEWLEKKDPNTIPLPSFRVDHIYLEAIDLSGTKIIYEGLENLKKTSFSMLSLRGCKLIDDFCLSRLHIFRDHLKYLDISECPRVTNNGVASLYKLRNLKRLRMDNMESVNNKELITLMLEEENPNLTVIGLDNATLPS